MIDDLTKIDNVRRNLMIFTSILLILTLTKTNIYTFNLLNIEFNLENAPESINTVNEMIFYLLSYLFIRFVSISSESKEYLRYAKSTMFFKSEDNINNIKKVFKKNIKDGDMLGLEKGVKFGKKIRIFFVIFEEIFLHKNFSIFFIPAIYYICTIIYFYFNIEADILINILIFFNILGCFYLLLILIVYTYLEKNFMNYEIRELLYRKKLKEKYDNIKLLKKNK
jgi:hypothetical protein